jgi:LuxR family maltose regulon positive regulatory protein
MLVEKRGKKSSTQTSDKTALQSASPLRYLPRSKFTAPAPSSFEVPRSLICERIAAMDSSRLVLIRAPAGFGKTTVMTQLRDLFMKRGTRTSWLTLDDGDNDITRFLSGLSKAIEHLDQTEPDHSSSVDGTDDLALSLMDRIAGLKPPFALFIDDLEAIRNPVVLGLVAQTVESLPAGSQLVICTRNVPDIGLGRMRAKGYLTEVDPGQLRFSSEEASDFLIRRRGIALTTEQVSQLHRSTEGWVAAIWLASISLQRRSDADAFISTFSGSNVVIADYLAEDVLAGLPQTLREFLLKSSILSDLTPALCDIVCKQSDSLEMLRQIERNNLFLIPIDDSRNEYRYHSLFRTFLRTQLERQMGSEVAGLHLMATQAYVRAGRPIQAIHHALQSEAWDVALPLLLEHVDALLGQGRLRLLAGWLDKLPAEVLGQHPRLKLIHAWSVAFTRGARDALNLIAGLDMKQLEPEPAAHLLALRPMLLAMIDNIEEAHRLGSEVLPAVSPNHPFAYGMLTQALTQTSIILGHHADARRFVDEARRAQKAATGTFGFVLTESADALLDLMRGHLKEATARMQLASKTFAASREQGRSGYALLGIQLAEALYESDECEQAKRLLEVYVPLVEYLGHTDSLICGHVILSRIVWEQNDPDRALQLMAVLEATGHRLGLPRAVASARLERARQRLAQNDPDGAREQLSLSEQAAAWPQIEKLWFIANDTLTLSIGRLRWLIRSGSAAQAIPDLKSELAEAERVHRVRRALKLRILLAEALHADGQHKIGLRTLSRALQSASTDGFIRTFLEEGPLVQSMIRELAHAAPEDGNLHEPVPSSALERLLGSMTAAPQAARATSQLAEPLTPKEVKVLNLLAQGYSNNAMADKLFISETTVRTHLRSINLKLQAGNRTQAIAIARRLGLIA